MLKNETNRRASGGFAPWTPTRNLPWTHWEAHSTPRPPAVNSIPTILFCSSLITGLDPPLHYLHQYLKEKCSVTAPTGKASYNVKGVTIHSLLKLPVGPEGHCDLKGRTLSTLQEQSKNIEYIIIDEYSMLGQITFGWIDKRLCQIRGKSDTVVVSQ